MEEITPFISFFLVIIAVIWATFSGVCESIGEFIIKDLGLGNFFIILVILDVAFLIQQIIKKQEDILEQIKSLKSKIE